MTYVVGDRIKESSTTTGTGNFTLDGAVSTLFRAFSAVAVNGDQVEYLIEHQGASEWESGIGTWTTGGVLQRTVVLASSNAGALVNFSAGTKHVFIPAQANHQKLSLAQRLLQEENGYIPVNCSTTVALDYEVAAGKTLEIASGGILEVT